MDERGVMNPMFLTARRPFNLVIGRLIGRVECCGIVLNFSFWLTLLQLFMIQLPGAAISSYSNSLLLPIRADCVDDKVVQLSRYWIGEAWNLHDTASLVFEFQFSDRSFR